MLQVVGIVVAGVGLGWWVAPGAGMLFVGVFAVLIGAVMERDEKPPVEGA